MKEVGTEGRVSTSLPLKARVGAIALAGLLVGMAWIASPAKAQTTGIAGTKHNLGTTSTANPGGIAGAGTDEVCVFCHTPHGANIDGDVAAPLWNRSYGVATYQTYDSLGTTTLDGGEAPIGSVSIACLSCHDGTQGMNVVINAPGSGGYDPAGAPISGTPTLMDPTIVANLSEDLRNDHPISIQYAGGGITQAAPAPAGSAYGDPDFNSPLNDTINGLPVWWIDNVTVAGNRAGIRDKTDMILYTRADGPAGQNEPFVECGSCHDPHSDANPTFLRISNTGSAVCLSCHVK